MIDIRKLKELVRLMVENELTELDLQDQQETVKIKRGADLAPVIYQGHNAPAPAYAHAASYASSDDDSARAAVNGTTAIDDPDLLAIESPMVGTFYSAPNPDSEAYVSAGSTISDDSVVCLVEAMKVFNEIKSGVSGRVEQILVKDGDAVEFGQKLFLVRPN